MIKNFVFDLGNVIIRWDPSDIVSHYADTENDQELLLQHVFHSDYWNAYDAGVISREQLIKNIYVNIHPYHHTAVYDMIHNWYKHCPIIQEISTLIQELKDKGYGIYLLSNTNIHFDEYKDSIPALALFDGYYISAQTKLIKPHPETFTDFLNTFSLEPESCFFVDDVMLNIEGAKKAGIIGHCFDGNIDSLRVTISKKTSISV